jgi:hypothetical protein
MVQVKAHFEYEFAYAINIISSQLLMGCFCIMRTHIRRVDAEVDDCQNLQEAEQSWDDM